MAALIMNKNNPIVIAVNGKVRNTRTGLRKRFSKHIVIPVSIATPILLIVTLGIIRAAIIIANVITMTAAINPFIPRWLLFPIMIFNCNFRFSLLMTLTLSLLAQRSISPLP